ncbi:MAG: hypothetical protein OEW97_09165 [Gammaproteobacteria bacterium]|nr:hypothetical protein [Gammaproteobacteria bacterium]
MTDIKSNQDECGKDGCTNSPENCSQDPESCMANSSFKKQLNSENMDDCMGRSLDQLSKAFMASARRWEMIVYPALFAFIILASYGFFLIYSLTTDISRVANDMNKITVAMERVAVNMDAVTQNMVLMTQTVDSQSVSMKEMTYHMRGMNMSMNQMRHDMSILNNSVSRPMSFMNDFMPW